MGRDWPARFLGAGGVVAVSAFSYVLKIEVDGHFHGRSDVPKPWVAEVNGPCPKYGLQRNFVKQVTDWKGTHLANSGNVYGRTAKFMLRDGVYEVSRTRGKPSKRVVVREYCQIEGGKRTSLKPAQFLAKVLGPGLEIRTPNTRDSWVAKVTRIGMPGQLGWLVGNTDDDRLYLAPCGLVEVCRAGSRRLALVTKKDITWLGHDAALEWLRENAR